MSAYIAAHPEYLEEIRRMDRQLEAWGFEPMPMESVKQPFDYPARWPRPSA